MKSINALADLGGRIGLSAIFLVSGIGKITDFAGTQAYMASQGVPGALLPAVIALEVLAPLLLVVGWQTRLAAFGLAGFSLAAGLLFHGGADAMQQIMLMKNIAIAGGLLVLGAHGAGAFSVDARRG